MAKITYTNKSTLNPQPSIANENKVTADDMNEIKTVVNGLVTNSYSTDTETTYSANYVNTATQITTASSGELRYIKHGSMVQVAGTILMNTQSKTFTLLYTPKYNLQYPATGIFSNYDNIASYGNVILTANSTTATINMNTATTRAVINLTYYTDD